MDRDERNTHRQEDLCDKRFPLKRDAGKTLHLSERLFRSDPISGTTPSPARETNAATVSETVLFVDDEASLRAMACRFLQRKGYRTHAAGSGEEALALFEDAGGSIGLVILDLSMPGMGGEACLRALRERSATVPVIVATGHGEGTGVSSLAAQDVAAVVHKPFRLQDLLQVVRRALGQA